MKLENLKNVIAKVKPYLFALVIAPIASWEIYCYAQALKIESQDLGQMRTFIQDSPRIEYSVQEGDSLDKLRDRFFPIQNKEFKGLDSKIFAYNQERFHNGEGYKALTADNLWTQIVRKENRLPLRDCLFNMYYVKEGRKIYVPVRETYQTIK